MTRRHASFAEISARARLGAGLLWCFVGLLFAALVVCGAGLPERSPVVAEVAGVAAAVEVDSPELDAPTTLLADYGLHGHLDAQPRYRRGARSRPPSHELDALAAETEDEDARSDALGVAFSLELPRDTLGRAVTHRRAHAILTSHLLVSTGLARGPPIA